MPARPVKMRYGRAKRVVFPPVIASVRMKKYPHDREIVQDAKYLPESIVWGSREHRLYLFLLNIYMKGGINSGTAIVSLSRFYEDFPEAFLPENLLGLEEYELGWVMDWLGWILPQYGLGVNITEAKQHWVWNLLKLARFWNSDPLNLFAGVNEAASETWKSYRVAKRTYAMLCRRLIRKKSLSHEQLMQVSEGFYGFQHKMASMIIYFFIHAGVVKNFAYPVPVDFHILRVLVGTGVLVMVGAGGRGWQYRERFLSLAREVTLRYVVETGVSTQDLSEGLWLLSRSLCRWHPGNRSSVEKTPKGEKGKARRRYITDIPFEWDPRTEKLHDKSCAICPIEEHCKWNVPSSYYYVKGVIRVRSKRSKPDNANRVQVKLLEVPPLPPKVSVNGDKPVRKLPVLAEAHPSLFE